MASGVEHDPVVWKFITGLLVSLAGALTYFIKKRDDKIEKNIEALSHLKTEVVSLKTHAEVTAREQREIKEALHSLSDCMQEVRIHLAGLPCSSSPHCGLKDRRRN